MNEENDRTKKINEVNNYEIEDMKISYENKVSQNEYFIYYNNIKLFIINIFLIYIGSKKYNIINKILI